MPTPQFEEGTITFILYPRAWRESGCFRPIRLFPVDIWFRGETRADKGFQRGDMLLTLGDHA